MTGSHLSAKGKIATFPAGGGFQKMGGSCSNPADRRTGDLVCGHAHGRYLVASRGDAEGRLARQAQLVQDGSRCGWHRGDQHTAAVIDDKDEEATQMAT